MKKVLGVIPARLGSTRLSRKMLRTINGKPLMYHTYMRTRKARLLDAVVIATDSDEIRKTAEAFGAQVIMTSTSIKSGSDRVAATVKKFRDFDPEIVINIQGDEPLISSAAIDGTVKALLQDSTLMVATPASRFKNERDIRNPGFVKVVLDANHNALYFSRSVIPFPRDPYTAYLKHIGLYGFRKEFLLRYTRMKQTSLEKAEKLEQLRILENGVPIRVVVGSFNTLEINTPNELRAVRRRLKK